MRLDSDDLVAMILGLAVCGVIALAVMVDREPVCSDARVVSVYPVNGVCPVKSAPEGGVCRCQR